MNLTMARIIVGSRSLVKLAFVEPPGSKNFKSMFIESYVGD